MAETGTIGSEAERVGKPACRDLGPARWAVYEAGNKGSPLGGWEEKYRMRVREAAG